METADKINILLVDDRLENLLALEAILADSGYQLVKATSGRDALRWLLKEEFAVILLDVQMPEMDGFETATLIRQREHSARTPIIFVTALSKTEVEMLCGYTIGAVDYIIKPIIPEVLRAKVQVFIDLFRMREEVRRQAEALAAANRQLETVNKELETFAYTVSHDLKAPLRGMEGFARALQEDYTDRLDETGRHYLDMVCGSAKRMGVLIDDLLQYSRVERRAMRWEPVNLERLIGDLVADRQTEIETREVRIERNLQLHEMAGEREGLQHALANLLDNALKFTRKVDRPAITITTRIVSGAGDQDGGGRRQEAEPYTLDPGEFVEVAVSDNGVGFDPKYREKAFAIFQRLHSQEEYEGTGIGLAIVRKVAERHGGRAWAESEPGRGATFHLAIPIREGGIDA